MAGISREDVVAYLSALGPGELQELILALEERWEIERPFTGPVHVTMGAAMGMPLVDEYERWIEVVLLAAGERRVQVMRAIREVIPIELQAAKALLDRTPGVITRDLPRDRAEALRAELEALGARVELRDREGFR